MGATIESTFLTIFSLRVVRDLVSTYDHLFRLEKTGGLLDAFVELSWVDIKITERAMRC